jgi:hypothetical protein
MSRIYRALNISAALAVALAGVAAADSWLAPTEQDYYSLNEAYYLHVVPGDGAKHAAATLYEVVVDAEVGGDALIKWSRDLVNPYAPTQVLVSDGGEYVVTSDDWGGVGYGPNVVVIYGPGGELVKQFALEDLLTEEEIALVPHSVSSRWWRAGKYINEENGVLVLKVDLGTEPYRSPETAPGVIVEKTVTISIHLVDGEVLP